MIVAPITAPVTLPSPPCRLAPPITTAAITSNSFPIPIFVAAVDNLPVNIIPASAQKKPEAA